VTISDRTIPANLSPPPRPRCPRCASGHHARHAPNPFLCLPHLWNHGNQHLSDIMLKDIPGVADFGTKIRILLNKSKRGGLVRFNIMKALRDAVGPLSTIQIANALGFNSATVRNHLEILISAEILIRNRITGFSYYGIVYTFSPITKLNLKDLDLFLVTMPRINPATIIWHTYGVCCKSCARGYDTPRYSEPCKSCKVARSNFVLKV